MRVLMWHVHGSYMTSFVQGSHQVLIPTLPDRGADGRGRAATWEWPGTAVEIGPEEAADAEIDVVVLQRPRELVGLASRWLGGRRPGREVPAVYLEHNTPQGRIQEMRHPAADRPDLRLVHVTKFNDLFWDPGTTPTSVIEHGIPDPGYRYEGDIPRLGVVINEPARRGRVTGTDLLDRFRQAGPIDLFGMGAAALGGFEDLPQEKLHSELARRRVYVHPYRWTSLGLSLIEAMQLGMPVVALATSETPSSVAAATGIVSTDVAALVEGCARLLADPNLALEMGRNARQAALDRHGLDRFLDDWNQLLMEVAS